MAIKSYNKYISFYINKLVFDNLHHNLYLAPPSFDYDIEIFYSLLNDLSNTPYYKKYEDNNAFVPLASLYLKKRYGSNYNLYLIYLTNQSIIAKSLYYSDNKCTHYKLNQIDNTILSRLNNEYYDSSYCFQYNGLISPLIFTDRAFDRITKSMKNQDILCIKIDVKGYVGKWIIKEHRKRLDRVNHATAHIRRMSEHYKKTIGIDGPKSLAHTYSSYERNVIEAQEDQEKLETATNRFNHRIASIMALKEGGNQLRFTRNKTNNRLDTNLTNMAKDLKPFLIDYSNLSYLDLCNSQPVLFNVLLRKKFKNNFNVRLVREMKEYNELTVGGKWYEFLMAIYNVNREEAKDIWMKIAYSKNDSYTALKRVFQKKFPIISDTIRWFKRNGHEQFSIELQKIESDIFIDKICKELVEQEIIPYTLHDGLLVPLDKEEQTYKIMTRVLKEHLGQIPVIAINDVKRYPSL